MDEVAETVTVPSVIGIDAETAKAQLEALGLTATIDGSGEVVNQLPSPGQVVLKGTNVTLYTAASIAETPESSENMALVPDVTGMTVIEARDALREAGFEIDIRSSGLAVRQTPGADEYAEKGSLVTVYFTLNLAAITQDGE